MSINWNWSNCYGECVDEKGNVRYLYPCNGLLVLINEWKQDGVEYCSLYDFRCDLEHEKNCVVDGIHMFSDMKLVMVDFKKMKEFYRKKELYALLDMFDEADSVLLVNNYCKTPPEDIEKIRKRNS